MSVGCMVAMNGILKQMTRELPVMVVLFFRLAFAVPLVLPWLVRSGGALLRTQRPVGHLLRSAVGVASMWCWVYAVNGMNLADFTAITFTRPLWIPLVGWLMLHEIVGLRRACWIALGFVGVLIAVRPQFEMEAAVLVALLGGAASSVTFVQVKQLATTEPSARIVFYYSAWGTLFIAPFAALEWVTPSVSQLGWLACGALTAAGGQYAIARACVRGQPTVITPVEFLQLPLATVVGFVGFGERPDLWVYAGTLLILIATLAIARQAHRDSRVADPAALL